ncbi:hypothetical protein JHK84_035350 [Glycine max]|nr:hypothetical protein JHK84_035350 [Glycine max]
MVADRVCPCLPMWDATKKKGFGLLKTRDMYKEDEGVQCSYEVKPHIPNLASKQSTTSNEVTSRGKGKHVVVIVYSTSFGPFPLNYAQSATVTRDQGHDMIGQAMESFVKRQCQENEQFPLSMQNAITTQFSYLDVFLLQNTQQAQMSMLEAVVAAAFVPQPPLIPAPLDPSLPPLAPIPPPPTTFPPPSQD